MLDPKIDRKFTSPLGSASETAEPACRMLGIDYTVEEWTHEVGDERLTPFPSGKMKSISFIQNSKLRENGNQDLSYDEAFSCPGIRESHMDEAIKYIEASGKEFLERLGYREENGVYRILEPSEEKVALFCHACFARAWLSVLLHIPLNLMWADFGYTHTGVTVLHFRNYKDGFTAPKCLCYSDMSHLYAAGLDMIYDKKYEL